jgi:ribosomal protein L11 methyltransferase
VAQQDWSRSWRAWHRPTVISPRLAIRPSFASLPSVPGQRVLVLDPGQAFGTGAHASTRLVLELLCGPLLPLLPGARVLDAGVGSGVLALSALLLGAGDAIGFDLDRLATSEARAHARCNDLETRLGLFTGPIEALGAGRFDLVLANLLRRELEPILPLLCQRVAAGGSLILSGLLEEDAEALHAQLARLGLKASEERRLRDDAGDNWLALSARR